MYFTEQLNTVQGYEATYQLGVLPELLSDRL